ncbi:MAG: electron transport complex subunit RsxC [Lachnospiraceae bacterium]|nr:electron transport complex subunit RsxC [Lachnospiraceae bacterium]
MSDTFNGGVHPDDGKALSKDTPVSDYTPTGELAYPLSQHIGAPAAAIVKKGDRVLRGQKIAEAAGFVSAHIYAGASGTVKGIEKRRTPVGDMADCIIIENDGAMECVPGLGERQTDPKELSREDIINRVKEAGVVGMGGAGFPNHVKLSPKEPDKIEYVIANCAECEPYLTSDYRMMLERPECIIGGLKIALSLFENAKGIIAIEDNKPDCIELMRELTTGESRITVKSLETKYPQGSERQLIYACTGRAINSKMLPADAGCIVDNADTLIAIYEAVTKEIPLIDRIVTVTGDAVADPKNFRVPIGTDLSELLEAAGGFKCTPEKVICGGPMMGFALFDLHVPITKTCSSLLGLREDTVSKTKSTACINCGECVRACPSRLIPTRLAAAADHGDEEGFESCFGLECMECGSCSYVCPAKRHLAQSIKTMRKIILGKKKNGK